MRTGRSALAALLVVAVALAAAPARAQAQRIPGFWFAGTRLIFERADRVDDEIAVRAGDPGLVRFLTRVGAQISWQASSRYVVVTTAERKTLTFTLGAPSFRVGPGSERIPLSAYLDGNDVYLPFLTLARALYVEPILQSAPGGPEEYVLQPQLGSLDARSDGRKTIVTLHAGSAIHFRKISETAERLTIALTGTASTLETARRINGPGLAEVDVAASGPARNPTTTVSFIGVAGSAHAMLASSNPNELTFAFGPRDVALGGTAVPSDGDAPAQPVALAPPPIAATVTPSPTAVPAASAPGAFVTAVSVEQPAPDAVLIRIATSASVAYDWHRLGDDRFYVDLHGATLSSAARDESIPTSFASALRVRQVAVAPNAVVRVALTVAPLRRIDVVADDSGLTVSVADADAGATMARSGAGQSGSPAPLVAASPLESPWKFGPANPRLIVLDPGHGGTDTGAMRNGLVEKDVALDVAQRLRSLLTARGWTVKMTRDGDNDVSGPNAADVAELQARCDVANSTGARMFISIHANSSTSTTPSGTTSYYWKPEDRPLAAAIQQHLVGLLGTKDDGVQKERFYVIRHTTMPAALIETAFVSNADDASRLRSADFRQQIAQGIADGVRDFAGSPGAVSQQQ